MELEISSMADSDSDINKKHHKYTLNEALPGYSNLSAQGSVLSINSMIVTIQ